MAKPSKDKSISVRLSQEMLEALDLRAEVDCEDRTQIIRNAIALYLGLNSAEDSVESRLEKLEERQSSIHSSVEQLQSQVQTLVFAFKTRGDAGTS